MVSDPKALIDNIPNPEHARAVHAYVARLESDLAEKSRVLAASDLVTNNIPEPFRHAVIMAFPLAYNDPPAPGPEIQAAILARTDKWTDTRIALLTMQLRGRDEELEHMQRALAAAFNAGQRP